MTRYQVVRLFRVQNACPAALNSGSKPWKRGVPSDDRERLTFRGDPTLDNTSSPLAVLAMTRYQVCKQTASHHRRRYKYPLPSPVLPPPARHHHHSPHSAPEARPSGNSSRHIVSSEGRDGADGLWSCGSPTPLPPSPSPHSPSPACKVQPHLLRAGERRQQYLPGHPCSRHIFVGRPGWLTPERGAVAHRETSSTVDDRHHRSRGATAPLVHECICRCPPSASPSSSIYATHLRESTTVSTSGATP